MLCLPSYATLGSSAKGPVAELVRQLPVRANFQAGVKKIPSFVSRQSIGLRPSPGRGCSHMDYSAAMWVGQGFRGFLDLHEKVFFLMQCPGVLLPAAGRV